MAPRPCADSRRSFLTRQQRNWKSPHQLGQLYSATAQSVAGQMVCPFAARQFYFRVAPIAAQLRDQPRHDRHDGFTAHERDNVIAAVTANFERLNSGLPAEPFRMPLAQ